MRRIEIDVTNCKDCPFRVFNGTEGDSGSYSWRDGYDCIHTDGQFRIIDDNDNNKEPDFPKHCPLKER